MAKKIGKVSSPQGIFRKGMEDVGGLMNALYEEAKCGCGIDCCNGLLVLPNYNSNSGDVDGYFGLYVVDGELVVGDVETARAAIKEFKADPLISATSVSISGCPVATLTTTATVQLTATVLPTGSLQEGTWLSLTPSVATVNGAGLVTPVADGTSIIRFTSTDGAFVANCTITVNLP